MGMLDFFKRLFGKKEGAEYKAKEATDASLGGGGWGRVHHSRFKAGRTANPKDSRRKRK